jgi:hypothetical protein
MTVYYKLAGQYFGQQLNMKTEWFEVTEENQKVLGSSEDHQ